MFPIALLDGISPVTLVFLGVIAVLLFGERLPEVARSLGKKFTDFRKNVQSIQDEIRSAAFSATSEISSALDVNTSVTPASSPSSRSAKGSGRRSGSRSSDEDYEEPTAPKFVPPPSEPSGQ